MTKPKFVVGSKFFDRLFCNSVSGNAVDRGCLGDVFFSNPHYELNETFIIEFLIAPQTCNIVSGRVRVERSP